MKMAVVGAGVVGLATGAGFAELGHRVHCVDVDESRIALLAHGKVPVYEPGLPELIVRNVETGRLTFGTELEPLPDADLVFLAVGTPSDDRGEMRLDALWSAVDRIRPWAESFSGAEVKILVIKSTVPAGTAERVERRLAGRLAGQSRVEVASIPEFIREGMAVKDFFEPARVVIGASGRETAERLAGLYKSFSAPVVMTDRRSAELAKMAANAFLSVKISFANELAELAERAGAHYPDIAGILGLDPRIGASYLGAGLGFGGSCLPKDTRALVRQAQSLEAPQGLLEAALRTNEAQVLRIFRKMEKLLPESGRFQIALMGLAFKPGTDDMREAPSLRLAEQLLRRYPDLILTAYDPAAGEVARSLLPARVRICSTAEEALRGADGAVLVTEWPEFARISPEHYRIWMNRPIIWDGRNALDHAALNTHGVRCIGMGRLSAVPAESFAEPEKPEPQ